MSTREIWFPKGEVKQSLQGVVEIACFLEQGVQRFPSTVEAALRSFWILLLGFSLNTYVLTIVRSKAELEHLREVPLGLLLYSEAVRVVFVDVFFILVLYALCKWRKCQEVFAQLITGLNWLQCIPLVIMTPLYMLVQFGVHNIKDASTLELMLLIYYLCASAFFISRCTKIPLYVGGYIVVMVFMIDQTSFMASLG